MFNRTITINQHLTLVLQYPTEIAEKDSLVSVDFYTPDDFLSDPSHTVQVNYNLIPEIIQICRIECQREDMLVIEYWGLFDQINMLAKGMAAA